MLIRPKKEESESLDLGEGFRHCPSCGMAYNKDPC